MPSSFFIPPLDLDRVRDGDALAAGDALQSLWLAYNTSATRIAAMTAQLALTARGPSSGTPDNLASFADATGKVLKDSGIPSPQVARRDQANVFAVAPQTISAATPALILTDTGQGADLKTFSLQNRNQELQVRAFSDAGAGLLDALRVTRVGDAYAARDVQVGRNVYERARAQALGWWSEVAYDVTNYTSNAGTWTVPGSGQLNYAWTIVGATMFVTLALTTTVAGAPTQLLVKLPNVGGTAMVAQRYSVGHIELQQSSGTSVGNAICAPGDGRIFLQTATLGAFAAGTVSLYATIPVNIFP